MGFLAISEIIPPGCVLPFAGTNPPSGWLICDGRAVSRAVYPALYSAVGTSHGSGDGTTTFNLPDYRGQFMRGAISSALNSITGSGTAASNTATFTAHGINRTGMKVRLNSGTLSGLSTGTTYYAIVVDSNTLAFAESRANALSSTKLAITGANSAVITQFEDPDTRSAFAVGGNSIGLGSSQTDQMQGHIHPSGVYYDSVGGGGVSFGQQQSDNPSPIWTGSPASDGTNGTPRTGQETRPQNVSVNYIIKV